MCVCYCWEEVGSGGDLDKNKDEIKHAEAEAAGNGVLAVGEFVRAQVAERDQSDLVGGAAGRVLVGEGDLAALAHALIAKVLQLPLIVFDGVDDFEGAGEPVKGQREEGLLAAENRPYFLVRAEALHN